MHDIVNGPLWSHIFPSDKNSFAFFLLVLCGIVLLFCLLAINDRELELGDNLALGAEGTGHSLSSVHTSNSLGGTGQDHVALLQAHDRRDVLDKLGDPRKEKEKSAACQFPGKVV